MKQLLLSVGICVAMSATQSMAQPVWEPQASGVSSYLLDIDFVSVNIGYAVGMDGVILKTIDGGNNWIQQTSGVTVDLWDCYFFSDQIGWACGGGGIVLRTINGGAIWTAQILATPVEFKQIDFIGQYAGIVAGKNTSTGYATAYYCSDGGGIWNIMSTPPLVIDILDIEFTSVTAGFLIDYNEVYHTSNSGLNWNIVSVPSSAQMNRVEMYDDNHGWLCGVDGTVLYTSDGGSNWTQQITPVSNTLWGISIVDLSTVFISGADGGIISTNDGGANWIENTTPTTDTLPSISAVDAGNAWSCGTDGIILKLNPLIDLQMVAYNGPTTVCPNVPFYISVAIKNIGQTTLDGGTFTVLDGINTVLVVPYTGGLGAGLENTMNLGQISISANTILTINFTGDDISTNNSLLQPITINSDVAYGTNGPLYTCQGAVATLAAFGGNSYHWLNAGTDSAAQYQNVVINQDQEYYVEIKQTACKIIDTVKVFIEDGDCQTTAFSPNDDGKNDLFTIESLPVGDNEVTIFNRWGDEINRITNYANITNAWNGTDQSGNFLPEGVYFYVVQSKADGSVLNGWVQVLR